MKTYTHTPAPWRIGSTRASVKVVDAEGKAVCMLTPRKGAWNGDLIAAAPDLFAALDYLLTVTVDTFLRDGDGLTDEESTARQKALAAIAKALGDAQ